MSKISVYDSDAEQPSVQYVFGGRLNSSEYVKITNEKNKEVSAAAVLSGLFLNAIIAKPPTTTAASRIIITILFIPSFP